MWPTSLLPPPSTPSHLGGQEHTWSLPKQDSFLQRGRSLRDPLLGQEGSPGLRGPPWDLEGAVCRNTECIFHSKSWQCCPRARGTRLGVARLPITITSVPPLTCPGHTASLWPQKQSPQRGPTRRGPLTGPGHHWGLWIPGQHHSGLLTSSTLGTAGLELSQGYFLGVEGAEETAKPDGMGGDAKGQRFVLVDYTKSSSANLLGQQNEKAGPFLGGTASDGTTEPTKKNKRKNKGSDPNLASAWGERKVWGWVGGCRPEPLLVARIPGSQPWCRWGPGLLPRE